MSGQDENYPHMEEPVANGKSTMAGERFVCTERSEAVRGLFPVNDLQLISNELVESARPCCDRHKITPCTPLNPDTLCQITLKCWRQ